MARLLLRDLTPGTAYKVQLRAVEGDSVSEWSRMFDLPTTADIIPPDVPAWGVPDFVVNGDTFVATWVPINFTLQQNIDFDHYELELDDNVKQVVVRTNNPSYTLSFNQNRVYFGTPKATIKARVRSVDHVGNVSAWSSQLTATNPPPAAPASISVTALLESIKVEWAAVSDIDLTGYKVQVSTTSSSTGFTDIYVGSNTTYLHNSIMFLTDHWFRVYAVDKFGSLSSATTSGSVRPKSTFTVDTLAPKQPTSLAAVLTNNTNGIGARAAVSWTAPTQNSDNSPLTDLAGYYVRYRKVGDTVYSIVPFTSDAVAGTVNVDSAYVNYEFQIKAYDWSNNESAWTSTVTATSPSNAAPANVTGLSANAGKDYVVAQWTPVADLDIKNYEVTFSTSSTFASGNSTYLTGTTPSLTVGGLNQGWNYYVRVRAVDTAGNTSAAWSSTASALTGTDPVPPSLTDGYAPAQAGTPTVMSGLSYLYVTWSPVVLNSIGGTQVDPVTYEVHLSTSSGFTPSGATKVTEVSGTSSVVDNLPGTSTALSYGTTYYIKLIAKDRDGSASASSQGSGSISKVASTDVTSIGADLIVPGTGFVNALVINTGGSIQSSNWTSLATGWKISPTGIEMNDAGSKIKVDALQAGVIGGVSGAGVIDVAAGTALRLNGGNLRSNTYNGTGNVYDPAATAGFYLGNDGLVIAQGSVSADTLNIGGTISTGNIVLGGTGTIQTAGYSGASGFRLSSTGLEIPDGSLSAQKLTLQVGHNLITAPFADFEANPSYYTTQLGGGNTIKTLDTTFKYMGTQSLKIVTTNAANSVYLGPGSVSPFSIPVSPSTTYIFSFYAMIPTGGVAAAAAPGMRFSTTTVDTHVGSSTSVIPANSLWNRYSVTLTSPATATGTAVANFQSFGNGVTVYIDAVQIEEKTSSSNAPSAWKPPGATTIVGDIIRTGSIMSSSPALDSNGAPISGVQAWSINTSGGAVFGDVLIRGKLIMGVSGDFAASIDSNGDELDTSDLVGISTMQSYNYTPGTAGWAVRSNGFAEFLQLKADTIQSSAISTLDPAKLDSGSITSGLVLASTITSQESQELAFTTKAQVGTVVTITTSSNHERQVGDRVSVKFTTPDAVLDSPGTTYDTVTAVTANTFSYIRPSNTIGSTAAAGTATFVGRSSVMDPGGLTLFDNDGRSIVVSLPTSPADDAYFSGSLNATSLIVRDNFSLQGDNNILNAGSTLVLAAGIVAPATAPVVSSSYANIATWIGTDYTGGRYGLVKMGANYVTANSFFGGGALYTDVSGGFAGNYNMGSTASAAAPTGGLGSHSLYNYALVNLFSDGTWQVWRYDANAGNGWSTRLSVWTYDVKSNAAYAATAAQWKSGGSLKEPTIGVGTVDGGATYHVYIARCNSAGKVGVARYSLTGTLDTSYGTSGVLSFGLFDNQNLRSIIVGNNELGTRVVITTQGNTTKSAQNYVCTTAGVQLGTETFPGATTRLYGTAWDSTKNAYVSLGENRRLYDYTSVANNGSNSWYIKSSWYDGDTTTYTPTAAVLTSNVATLTVPAGHGFVADDVIQVAGYTSTYAAFNGSYTLTATTSTTLSYAKTAANIASGTSGAPVVSTLAYESPLSIPVGVTVTRRSRLTVTAGSIPDSGRHNDPDRVRFYISNTTSGGSYYRQPDLTAGSKSALYTAQPTFSGSTGPTTAFPTGTAARFTSSNGKMEITADGYALFGSSTDASTASGNRPALRIGNPSGQHLRIDDNEIIAMSSDSVQGILHLNAGGGTQIGGGMNLFAINANEVSTTADGNGRVTVNHGLGVVPAGITLTAKTNHICKVFSSSNATSFVAEFHTFASGNPVAAGASVTFGWIAVG